MRTNRQFSKLFILLLWFLSGGLSLAVDSDKGPMLSTEQMDRNLAYSPGFYDRVNNRKFAFLSLYWGMTGCDKNQPCAETDWFLDGTIDLYDLMQLAASWLDERVLMKEVLFREDFEDGDLAGWTVVDQGDQMAPSAWSVSGGILQQTSHIYSNPTAPSALAKPGTFLRLDGGNSWSDYSVTFKVHSLGYNDWGLMFRVQEEGNYYRFSWNHQAGYARLVKVVNGVASLMEEVHQGYARGQEYRVTIVAEGEILQVYVDEVLFWEASDGTFPFGTIALYTWGNAPATYFDDFLVVNLLPEGFVRIPGGTFQMGNSKDASEGWDNELPVHPVTLSSYAMGKYEVTNGQYCDFLHSAYPSQLKVVNGVVYASDDAENSFPYCSTSSASSSFPNYGEYSQIAFSDDAFGVLAKGGKDMTSHPVVCVSWYGAAAYCNWRSRQDDREICYDLSAWTCDFTKNGYRLPTEAEWEYAARGGLSGKRFPWGDSIAHDQANYYSSGSYSYDISTSRGYHPIWNDGLKPYTSPVGSFSSNAYGLYDMAGNAYEWCHDWYAYTYYSSSPPINPTGPDTDSNRVLRGGSWDLITYHSRVSTRSGSTHGPGQRSNNVGFRIVWNR